jgi:hypothetical protein
MKLKLLLLILLYQISIYSQRNVEKEAIGTPWIGIQYGLNVPQFDLKERFGLLNHLGVLAGYKTKSNWFFGIDANFILNLGIDHVYSTWWFLSLLLLLAICLVSCTMTRQFPLLKSSK